MTPPSCVLVLADPYLRDAVEIAARLNGYRVLACRTPLEAIQLLEMHSRNIGYAVLSSAAPQALELRELLTDEYPAIQQFVLST